MSDVLIIEDSPEFLTLSRETLLAAGCAVRSSPDMVNGLLLLRNHAPDVVLLGVHVRHRRGWEGLEKLRKAAPSAVVTVLGSIDTPEARREAEERGAAGYIPKTLSRQEFLSRIVEASRRGPAGGGGSGAMRQGRILVVDDEEVVRAVLSRFLAGKGYEVVTAADGAEALEKVKVSKPHLMLLDIRMPGVDGFGVLRALKERGEDVAVMMITANTDLESARKTLEMGACDYIVKPFPLEYLETTVMTKLLMVTA